MTAPDVRILGVDPGSRKTGWGIVDIVGPRRTIRHVDNGVFMLEKFGALPDRLRELSLRLAEVIEQYRPSHSAVEDVFVRKGPRSALVLGQARGAALATLGLSRLPVDNYAPTLVKARITGRGRASKLQVAEMVSVILGLAEHPFEDAADALAVALCRAMQDGGPRAAIPATTTPKRGQPRGGRASFEQLARAQGKIS